jgi:hypothetical protein
VSALDPTVILLACLALAIMTVAIWAPSTLAIFHRRAPNTILDPPRARIGLSHPSIARFILRGPPSSWTTASSCGLLVVAAAFVAYLTMFIPVQIPVLARAQADRYWPAAFAAAVLVAVYDGGVIAWTMRQRTRGENHATIENSRSAGVAPPELRFQRVSARITRISGIASCAGVAAAVIAGFPLWCIALAALIPWLPVFTIEAAWKYEHYGLYAFLLVVTGLQLGHVGEHAAQVTQLLMTNGNLARSHGVFGQLDFETVHFFWDTGIWLSTGLLVSRFSGSRWLWVAFAAASLHEVEHVYLYWLVMDHHDFYMQGGLAGILGRGGVIGSPLYRPYLHFMYNVLVAVPMLMALLEQTRAMAQPAQAFDRTGRT